MNGGETGPSGSWESTYLYEKLQAASSRVARFERNRNNAC